MHVGTYLHWVGYCILQWMCEGQRTTSSNWFFPSTVWVPRSNSGSHPWQQVPLVTEPDPLLSIFSYFTWMSWKPTVCWHCPWTGYTELNEMRTSSDNICSNGEKVKGTQLKNVTQNNVTIYIHDQYCRRSLKGETLGPGEDLVASMIKVQWTAGRRESVGCFHTSFFDTTAVLRRIGELPMKR